MTFNLKTLLVILTLASLPCALNGQSYSIDHQAGAILKLVSARMNISSDLVSTSSTEAEVGYQFGGFYRINIDKIYVQPEVLFSKIKTQLVFNDYNGVPGFNPMSQFEFNTLELPLNIGYRIGNLRFMMGPSFSILLSGERSFLNNIEKVTSEYNQTNFMWHWGIGGDFERIFVDIKYESGLSKTGESLSNLNGREFVPKQRQWVISVALNLLKD